MESVGVLVVGQGLQSKQVEEARCPVRTRSWLITQLLLGTQEGRLGATAFHSVRTPRKYGIPFRVAKIGATFNLEWPETYVCFCVLVKKREKANFSFCSLFHQIHMGVLTWIHKMLGIQEPGDFFL